MMIKKSDIQNYINILQKDPKSKLFVVVGEIYRRAKRFEQAIQICLRGIKYNPDFPSGHLVLARIYYDLGNLVKAKEEFSKILAISSDNLLALTLLGDIYLNEKDIANARKIYKKLSLLNRDNRSVKSFIDKYHKVISITGIPVREIEYMPETLDAIAGSQVFKTESLASIYEKQELYEKAIEIYNKILDENPDNKAIKLKLNRVEQLIGYNKLDKRIIFLKNLLKHVQQMKEAVNS